jgi:hypothetical protein
MNVSAEKLWSEIHCTMIKCIASHGFYFVDALLLHDDYCSIEWVTLKVLYADDGSDRLSRPYMYTSLTCVAETIVDSHSLDTEKPKQQGFGGETQGRRFLDESIPPHSLNNLKPSPFYESIIFSALTTLLLSSRRWF